MVMALRLFHHRTSGYLMVAAGYESGHTSLFQLCTQKWTRIYTSQPHSQPGRHLPALLSHTSSSLSESPLTPSSLLPTPSPLPRPLSLSRILPHIRCRLSHRQTPHSFLPAPLPHRGRPLSTAENSAHPPRRAGGSSHPLRREDLRDGRLGRTREGVQLQWEHARAGGFEVASGRGV